MSVEAMITQRVTMSEEMREGIRAVEATATDAERKEVATLIAQAQRGEREIMIKTITPAPAAILFLEYNPHNRDWSPLWSKELARRQTAGQWRWNNASIGFYRDGALADGQNRLAAVALAGYTLVTGVVLGMDRDAITTIDGGKIRHAADAAKLDGITNARHKEVMVRTVAAYLVRTGDRASQLRSETEIAEAIAADNVMLEDACEIGTTSCQNVLTPPLRHAQAHCIAYLMLKGGWPVQRIREKLAFFQCGVSKQGEHSPYFVAGQVLNKARDARSKRERLTPIKELGIVMYAMTQTEQGITAVQRSKFKDVVRRELPNPAYPASEMPIAAE